MTQIELNPEFVRGLKLIEGNNNVFITGKAGTGKSTLLSYLRANANKNLVILAPTGVAAINVSGQTIHSFFKFKPDITVEKVKKEYKNRGKFGFFKKIDTIIIDEISMVRADLLDCVDAFLKMHGKSEKLHFGGIQMIFIGDLYQLPPVVVGTERNIFKSVYESPYFFSANALFDFDFELVELEKIYRQKDDGFIKILNSIRNRTVTDELLTTLNIRVNPEFDPKDEFYIYLTTTNVKAQQINDGYLNALSAKKYLFEGRLSGNFDQKSAPASLILELKVGAQIMLVNNDRQGRWVNGTVGKVTKIERDDDENVIYVELPNGKIVEVYPHTWEMFKFVYNDRKKILESEIVGSFTQYPLILAWAITIHKSQGKTFEKVIVDMDRGAFAHGQTYVALSRCVSLEGLVLKQPIKKSHILLDYNVVRFLTNFQYQKSDQLLSLPKKIVMIKSAIENREKLEITYLKSSDEKSKRVIKPYTIGDLEYQSKTFLGIEAYDFLKEDDRVFRVDRILEIKII